MTVKTTNALMKHLRDHEIKISGSTEKRQLKNLGYYHLYKGYRFYKVSDNQINFHDFSKIRRTYEYDIEIKNLLYRWTNFLEIAFKNNILQTTLEFINSSSLRDFYDNALENGSAFPLQSQTDEKKKAISNRLQEIKFLQSKILENYNHSNPIICHHYDQNNDVPLWGLFEILTFGDLGNLVRFLKRDLRREISREIGISLNNDPHAKVIEQYIFLIKDLRNAIAHDNVVYDGRFIKNSKGRGIRKSCIQHLETETKITNINFSCIEDLLILICYLLKLFKVEKRAIKSLVNRYIDLTNDFINDINDPLITKRQIRVDTIAKAKKILVFL